NDVVVAKNAVVKDSILLPGVIVEDGARVYKAIVNEIYVIEKSEVINEVQQEIILISE
ncbi:TPA: glucose-1-phosphate adenylyltransferase, partial [bacterium]|nr:glucose-1-phosphate adenylyltransferase [bacterium]